MTLVCFVAIHKMARLKYTAHPQFTKFLLPPQRVQGKSNPLGKILLLMMSYCAKCVSSKSYAKVMHIGWTDRETDRQY